MHGNLQVIPQSNVAPWPLVGSLVERAQGLDERDEVLLLRCARGAVVP